MTFKAYNHPQLAAQALFEANISAAQHADDDARHAAIIAAQEAVLGGGATYAALLAAELEAVNNRIAAKAQSLFEANVSATHADDDARHAAIIAAQEAVLGGGATNATYAALLAAELEAVNNRITYRSSLRTGR